MKHERNQDIDSNKPKHKSNIHSYLAKYHRRFICYLLVICTVASSYFLAEDQINKFYENEFSVQALSNVQAQNELDLAFAAKEEKRLAIEAENARIEALRIEAERVEAERIAAIKKEEARIAAEKKAAEEKARQLALQKKREQQLAAQKKREEAAKAEAERKEVIAAEKAKADAEKKERARISSQIRAQAAIAQAEQAEYDAVLPEAIVSLPVTNIMQNPELPNGCEITSLAILLNYKGFYADKGILSDSYLAKFPFYATGKDNQRAGGNPDYYFAGNPRNVSNAYYCFAGPVVDAATKYLNDQSASYQALDITGTGEQGLIDQLEKGNPVITWGTLSMGDAFTFAPNAWTIDENGNKHTPFLNLHCVVLTGYDHSFFYFADPLRGNVAYKRTTFMNAYRQLGSRAVIIE